MAKKKLNSIEIDMDISHEEYTTILKEKDKYDKVKDNLRSEYIKDIKMHVLTF